MRDARPSRIAPGARSTAPASAGASADAGASTRRMRYIPALDGIRALAVIAVVLYHLHLPGAAGGLLGVTVFFVLSGYLITRLLFAEFSQTGRIDFKGFYTRRVRRLVPAIVAVVVVTIILCTIFNHVMLTKMRPDILPSLVFINNWWQILNQVSYFNAVGDPSPLTHFWSLAIEEQFYLLWPPLIYLIMRMGGRLTALRRLALGLAVCSIAAMFILYNPAADPSRVYYGTDTRAFSILLGAWLAFIPEGQLRQSPATSTPARFDALGLAAIAGLVLMCVFVPGYASFQYRGGTLLTTLLTLVLIAASVQGDSALGRVLSLPPLTWLGTRSYSIYLWHYPLLLLMNPVANVSETPWWMTLVQIAIVLAVAEASYRFIETPFRHGAAGRIWARLKELRFRPSVIARAYTVPCAAIALVTAVAVGGLVFVPDTSALSEEGAALLNPTEDTGAAADSTESGTADADGETAEEGASPDAEATGPEGSSGEADLDMTGFPQGAYDVLMIGDSVSLRAVDAFQATFPHGHIDAAMNRQFTQGEAAFESYLGQNLAGKIAVFALGTNGLVTAEQIDSVMADVGDRRLAVFVTTRSPQPWVQATNDAFWAAAERYPNVRVVDWFGHSAGRNDLFDGDGTHLSASGAQDYVNLIYETVENDLPFHIEDHQDQPEIANLLGAVQNIRDGVPASAGAAASEGLRNH